jgi:hypothetical protein
MRKALSFQLSPEATADESLLEKRSILNLILAVVLQTSVQYTPDTKPKLTGQDINKLVASGLPDSVVLNAIEVSDTKFLQAYSNPCRLTWRVCAFQLVITRRMEALRRLAANRGNKLAEKLESALRAIFESTEFRRDTQSK